MVYKSLKAVQTLEQALVKFEATDYYVIDRIMKRICKFYKITPKELHKDFVQKNKMIPDTWIRKVLDKHK